MYYKMSQILYTTNIHLVFDMSSIFYKKTSKEFYKMTSKECSGGN